MLIVFIQFDICSKHTFRALFIDSNVKIINFLISQPKQMTRFFSIPKIYVKTDG